MSVLQQHIFLAFYQLLALVATTEEYKSMKTPASLTGHFHVNVLLCIGDYTSLFMPTVPLLQRKVDQ